MEENTKFISKTEAYTYLLCTMCGTGYQSDALQALNMCKEYEKDDIEVVKHGHWIYSGDEDSYDNYYINCSCCGRQFYAYDRNNERQDNDRCPCCGAKMTRKGEI